MAYKCKGGKKTKTKSKPLRRKR